MSSIVIASARNIPENITPNIAVVEYNNTVLTVPIIFSAIKKNNVDIPVPNIEMTAIPGNCAQSTSNGISKATIIDTATAAQIKDVNLCNSSCIKSVTNVFA